MQPRCFHPCSFPPYSFFPSFLFARLSPVFRDASVFPECTRIWLAWRSCSFRNLRIEEDGVILMMLVDFHFPKKRLLSKTEKRFKMKFSVDKYCVPTCSVLEPQCNNARAKRVRIVFCDRVWRDQPRGKTKGGAAPEVFSRG